MADRAIVQRFQKAVVGDMVSKERARLPCGCSIFVGLRNNVPATGARPCSADHTPILDKANELLTERIAGPPPDPPRLLVEVCAEVLTEAARGS